MKVICFSITIILLNLPGLYAQQKLLIPDDRLAHTYSIVARDSATGEMAVGVQSHWFSVGTAVPWAEAGVGVVATQSFTNISFGTKGLDLLKSGISPQEALDSLLSVDEGRDYRQVAIMDKQGRVAVHTGKSCIQYAGHKTGDNFSVQANMMLTDKVWPAMAEAFQKNEVLPLAERVVETLKAAEKAGGDIRGKQSAALIVVKARYSGEPWNDRLVDLRVDDHQAPLEELARLLRVHRAYEHMNKGDLAVEKGDMEKASSFYKKAAQLYGAENLEMQYWHAITLANNGHMEKAKEILKEVFHKNGHWRELTSRLPQAGLLTVSEDKLQDILNL